ncbi:MAG: hypothetical protein ACF8NJ_05315 [Phycisphaerales bacterium JB038]
MRFGSGIIITFVCGLLYAAAALLHGVAWAEPHGHHHAHVHQHDGSHDHHGHSHDETPVSAKVCDVDLPQTDGHEHECCGDHHHGAGPTDEALPGRSRDSVPTSVTVASAADLTTIPLDPRVRLRTWPYARGRPPDHLNHVRTIVLLT